MKLGPRAMRAFWNGYWDAMRSWHRFEVKGLDHLDDVGSCLFVGYHGRAVAHDMILLGRLLEGRDGSAPKAVVHKAWEKIAPLAWLSEGLEWVTEDGDAMRSLFARGESVMVTPGGPLEGCRSIRDRYHVRWGDRHGYLKLAIKYGLPIVPTAGTGVDETFIGLNDGYAWGKRLGLPMTLPLWFAFGLTGPWPFTLPFPSKIVCHIGAPIDPHADGVVDTRDKVALARLHRRVAGAVQDLLDDARGVPPTAPDLRPTGKKKQT
jgi:hypothetical protein